MSLTLASEQRQSLLRPVLVAVLALGVAGAAYFYFNPHHTATVSITHVDIFAPATVFNASVGASRATGQKLKAEQNLYAVVTVRVQNELRVPLFIDEVDGSYAGTSDVGQDAVAPGSTDLERMQQVFPQLKALMPHPLLMGDTVPARSAEEGQVLLHYNALTEQDWKKRRSSSVTVRFAHNQGALEVPLP